MFYHKGLKPKTFRAEFDFLFVSIVLMVGLSNPFCWAWRQKGRPESIWGVWGNTGEGSTAGWVGGRIGQGWVQEQDSRVSRGRGVRLLRLGDRVWGGQGRTPLVLGPSAQPLPLTQCVSPGWSQNSKVLPELVCSFIPRKPGSGKREGHGHRLSDPTLPL